MTDHTLDPTAAAANNGAYPDVGTYCMMLPEDVEPPIELHDEDAIQLQPQMADPVATPQQQQIQGSIQDATAPDRHDPTSPAEGATFHDLLEATGAAYQIEHYVHQQQQLQQQIIESPPSPDSRKRRICRFPDCDRYIKSQGHCQRHGAAVKRCKVDDCEKQSQGAYDGMCKRHWRDFTCGAQAAAAAPSPPPLPTGESVYETILPHSITYKPTSVGLKLKTDQLHVFEEGAPVMPLVVFLRNNAHREFAWHRVEERRARGCFPLASAATRLENWERQLVLVEILLLAGGTPYASFKDLAHAWGRERNFHTTLAASIFERRGDLERKRRSDAGKPKAKRSKPAAADTAASAAAAEEEEEEDPEMQKLLDE